ncbi:DUF86 domain-containing protein [Halobacillus sp. BAB-2008]|uniref:DUF86 domain-containing protein n=1 Tax=Halobacillus sp. BAB-2008 TaxID=1246484 RepID=UPI0002A50FCA|nr:DUF86 domain-containing protein [Halobacillus sp. BAB-2008]ELK46973.1 hypothetical protein D479_08391 [Halobacillus sp. BAB-2008]
MNTVLQEVTENRYETFSDRLLLERTTHVTIEAILDVGNMMIDGFIMRDPGSYEDIIDILTDEQVLPKGEAEAYKAFIGLRKMIVQEYTAVDHQEISGIWNQYKAVILSFPEKVRSYLDTELGPVSTFTNND